MQAFVQRVADPAPDFLRTAIELGATRCLRKPFTPAALLMTVNECLALVGPRLAEAVPAG
jgi:CheY-like chemotaxis protein